MGMLKTMQSTRHRRCRSPFTSDVALHVAAVSTIIRFNDIESRLDDPPAPVLVTDRLPSEGHHGWKVLEFGPDGLLYLPVGAPCDVCRTEGYHGTILRMQRDGSGIEVYARGLRNSVGLAWHPVTGELWFTDNGSDHLGPDLPPDELNRAPGPGLHYGFPVLPCRNASRSRLRERRALRGYRGARTDPGRARRAARPRHSFRNQHAESLSGRGIHCGTRALGTGVERSATGFRWCASPTTTGPRWATRRLPRDGTATGGGGDGRPTSSRHPTAQSWCPTTGPGESTGSGTWADNRRPIPQPARAGAD